MKTQKKDNKLILVFVTLLVLFWVGTGFAKTWYISPTGSNIDGDGSMENPWFSPAKARKSQSDVAPGDTVVFLNGTYHYDEFDCALGGGSDDAGTIDAPIVYKAEDDSHSVILDFSTNWGWRLGDQYSEGAANIILDGFVLVNFRAGVRFMDSNQIGRNLWATATATWPPSGDANSHAISGGCFMTYQGARNFLFENCIADNCGYNEGTSDTPNSSSHGIYIHSGGGTIRHCIFRNNIGCGIQIQAAEAVFQIDKVYVYGNKSVNNGAGIYCSAYGGGTIEAVYIFNNLIADNAIGRANGYGITVNHPAYAEIQNNTLYHNRVGLNVQNTAGYVRNNIVVNSTDGDISWGTSQNNNIIKSNNLTTTGSENALYGVSGAFSLSDFQSIDPDNENFLKLKETADTAINAGADTGISNDYFGVLRTDGAIDIGACEYPGYTSRDVNQDGSVNVSDVQLVVNVILGNATNDRADVNGDERVTVSDVQEVVNEVIG